MTKKQAYELAKKELPNSMYYEMKERATEIYTEAFTEWSYEGGWFKRVANGKNIWFRSYLKDTKQYTFAEMIQLFEQEN